MSDLVASAVISMCQHMFSLLFISNNELSDLRSKNWPVVSFYTFQALSKQVRVQVEVSLTR